jgi:ATP-binding cassette subfamily F protein uup
MIKAGMLSGGERNRLLLAKLFTRPGNVLVLDEPTNDLDIETLALLEELLVDFEGTVLVVSHDREFLDNVATSTLSIDSDGVVEDFVGGWSDWRRQHDERVARAEAQHDRDGGQEVGRPAGSEGGGHGSDGSPWHRPRAAVGRDPVSRPAPAARCGRRAGRPGRPDLAVGRRR